MAAAFPRGGTRRRAPAASATRAPTFRRPCCMPQSRSPAPPPWTAFGVFPGLLAFLAAAGRRWGLLGAGSALAAAVLAAATSLALQSPERDWGAEARAAAQRSVLESVAHRAPDEDGVQFADVEVRRTDNDDERWVCGSFAAWGDEGSLGPFRDFWVTVARVPGTGADIREVRANEFGRDDFLDRNSPHFRACFDGDDMG